MQHRCSTGFVKEIGDENFFPSTDNAVEYIETDEVLVCRGKGNLSALITQSNSLKEQKQQIKDIFCGYIDAFPECIKKVSREEWKKEFIL